MEIGITWHGFGGFMRWFKEVAREHEKALKKRMDAAVLEYKREAMKHVPVGKSGFTRASIRGVTEKKRWGFQGVVGTNKPEALYTEYGTKRHWVGPKDKQALAWGAKRVGGRPQFFSRGHYVSGIRVGTEHQPRTIWPAKSATRKAPRKAELAHNVEWMPWLRPSWHQVEPKVMAHLAGSLRDLK